MKKIFIIAEAGVNHNGSAALAKRLIDAALRSGADAVKFQTFRSEMCVTKSAPKALYQTRTTLKGESQLEMSRKLELSDEDFRVLRDYAAKKGIMFLSTPFDLESVDFLDKLGLKIFKIPSGEIVNLPYLRKVGGLRKKIIMSTGMSDLREVKKALSVLIKSGTAKRDVTVLHCNTEYPTPMKDVNLSAMVTIRKSLGVRVGYSDHTLGIEVPVAAAALGAEVIEKHLTLDRKMKGPDHRASLEPDDFRKMVISIRNIEMALGDGNKRPSPSELKNKNMARKSIVASRPIKKGGVFSEYNITVKRPGTGMSPMRWDKVMGRTAKKDFMEDEAIRL
ncbi:MAG: N-acetylneuraminate synthase [Candidatus Omnitrophota bacterium]